jgi:hypothetical protein
MKAVFTLCLIALFVVTTYAMEAAMDNPDPIANLSPEV